MTDVLPADLLSRVRQSHKREEGYVAAGKKKKKNNMQQFAVSAGCVCVCVCGVCGAPHCAARVQTLGADNLSGNECNVAVG